MKKISFCLVIFFLIVNSVAKAEDSVRKLTEVKKTKKTLLYLYTSLITKEYFIPLEYKDLQKVRLLEEVAVKGIRLLTREEKRLKRQTSLTEEEKKMVEEIKLEVAKKYRNAENGYAIVDPLSGKPTAPRNFNGVINHPISIFAPFSGKIDSLGMRGTTLFIILKGKRCNATISGIDDLTINIGSKVSAGEVIGKVEKVPKNFSFKVECSK